MGGFKDGLKYGRFTSPDLPRLGFPSTNYQAPIAEKASWSLAESAKPLESGQRGIILSQPVEVSGSKLSTREFDVQELRFAVLFFDKIEYPSNNIIEISPPDEIEWLKSEGIVQRTHCVGSGTFDASCIITAQKFAFDHLQEISPGAWSIGRSPQVRIFDEGDVNSHQGLRIKIERAIPVPDREVPLFDVLEFRHRRTAELLNLRHELERTYQRILSEPDRPLAELTEIEALERAIADHVKVSREFRFPFKLMDFQGNLSAGHALDGAVAFSTSRTLGLPLVESAMVGIATMGRSFLTTGIGVGLRKSRNISSPFEYISKYHEELF